MKQLSVVASPVVPHIPSPEPILTIEQVAECLQLTRFYHSTN
jgi:hypothetical protein